MTSCARYSARTEGARDEVRGGAGRGLRRGRALPYTVRSMTFFVGNRVGGLRPHEHLPSERVVADFDVSRTTVRQALRDLVREGYLYSAPGKGFFAAERPRSFELNALLSFMAFAGERGLEPKSRVVRAEVVPATPALARHSA